MSSLSTCAGPSGTTLSAYCPNANVPSFWSTSCSCTWLQVAIMLQPLLSGLRDKETEAQESVDGPGAQCRARGWPPPSRLLSQTFQQQTQHPALGHRKPEGSRAHPFHW